MLWLPASYPLSLSGATACSASPAASPRFSPFKLPTGESAGPRLGQKQCHVTHSGRHVTLTYRESRSVTERALTCSTTGGGRVSDVLVCMQKWQEAKWNEINSWKVPSQAHCASHGACYHCSGVTGLFLWKINPRLWKTDYTIFLSVKQKLVTFIKMSFSHIC